jgi:hypothetical protein
MASKEEQIKEWGRGHVEGGYVEFVTVGLQNALEVACRPSFGSPKPIRCVYAGGTIKEMGETFSRPVLREIKANGEELPERIEKFWPETNEWQCCWDRELGYSDLHVEPPCGTILL